MKKVTIQDMANELGLSRNTVSKALVNSETVAPETRYIVLKKAYERGYSKLKMPIPEEIKENYRRQETKTIMVLARQEVSSFWNRIIMGISDELSKNQCRLQLNFISAEDEEKGILPMELKEKLDGLIVLSVFRKSYVELLTTIQVPIVFLDAPVHAEEYSDIGDVLIFEGESSVRRMTAQLIKQGLHRIAFIGDITYCKSISDRFDGFRNALHEAGLQLDSHIICNNHMPKRYYDRSEVENAINTMPYIPDAIVCANDDIAKDVYWVLKQKGIQIPKDVAVVGFDNKEESEVLSPTLTTVSIQTQNMGRRLVARLLWRIEHPAFPKELDYITTEVIYRESSGKQKNIL